MQISPLTIYAIQTIREIQQHGPLPGEEIARRLDISLAYAKKTLHALRRRGLVKAQRRQGYVVVGCPKLRQVVEATEGILADQEGETRKMRSLRARVRRLLKDHLQKTLISRL